MLVWVWGATGDNVFLFILESQPVPTPKQRLLPVLWSCNLLVKCHVMSSHWDKCFYCHFILLDIHKPVHTLMLLTWNSNRPTRSYLMLKRSDKKEQQRWNGKYIYTHLTFYQFPFVYSFIQEKMCNWIKSSTCSQWDLVAWIWWKEFTVLDLPYVITQVEGDGGKQEILEVTPREEHSIHYNVENYSGLLAFAKLIPYKNEINAKYDHGLPCFEKTRRSLKVSVRIYDNMYSFNTLGTLGIL